MSDIKKKNEQGVYVIKYSLISAILGSLLFASLDTTYACINDIVIGGGCVYNRYIFSDWLLEILTIFLIVIIPCIIASGILLSKLKQDFINCYLTPKNAIRTGTLIGGGASLFISIMIIFLFGVFIIVTGKGSLSTYPIRTLIATVTGSCMGGLIGKLTFKWISKRSEYP